VKDEKDYICKKESPTIYTWRLQQWNA